MPKSGEITRFKEATLARQYANRARKELDAVCQCVEADPSLLRSQELRDEIIYCAGLLDRIDKLTTKRRSRR